MMSNKSDLERDCSSTSVAVTGTCDESAMSQQCYYSRDSHTSTKKEMHRTRADLNSLTFGFQQDS